MRQGDIRSVHVIWCDDVRQEVGNKASYMGIYQQHLVPPSLPTVLPKLCAVINVTTPMTQPFKALQVRVIRNDAPGAPIVEIDANQEDVQTNLRPPAPSPEGSPAAANAPTAFGFTAVLALGQLELTAQTEWLQVIVDMGDEVLESLKLRVTTPERMAQPAEAATAQPKPD